MENCEEVSEDDSEEEIVPAASEDHQDSNENARVIIIPDLVSQAAIMNSKDESDLISKYFKVSNSIKFQIPSSFLTLSFYRG